LLVSPSFMADVAWTQIEAAQLFTRTYPQVVDLTSMQNIAMNSRRHGISRSPRALPA